VTERERVAGSVAEKGGERLRACDVGGRKKEWQAAQQREGESGCDVDSEWRAKRESVEWVVGESGGRRK
jgi:hypothetical protein